MRRHKVSLTVPWVLLAALSPSLNHAADQRRQAVLSLRNLLIFQVKLVPLIPRVEVVSVDNVVFVSCSGFKYLVRPAIICLQKGLKVKISTLHLWLLTMTGLGALELVEIVVEGGLWADLVAVQHGWLVFTVAAVRLFVAFPDARQVLSPLWIWLLRIIVYLNICPANYLTFVVCLKFRILMTMTMVIQLSQRGATVRRTAIKLGEFKSPRWNDDLTICVVAHVWKVELAWHVIRATWLVAAHKDFSLALKRQRSLLL